MPRLPSLPGRTATGARTRARKSARSKRALRDAAEAGDARTDDGSSRLVQSRTPAPRADASRVIRERS
eukprot:22376-Pelagococcus_subviridis.AAC.5